MGRLDHLAVTLPHNLAIPNDADVEFVILNYNSQDGLDDYMRTQMQSHIDRGLINYYHTTEPESFNISHAKNVAHKVAQGEILVNLDADNFLVDGYLEWMRELFSQRKDIILLSPATDCEDKPGSCGKIAVLREHFHSVNGYDESHEGWGCEDTNFQLRARLHNDIGFQFCSQTYCRVLDHDDSRRVENYRATDMHKSRERGLQTLSQILQGADCVANQGQPWGQATLRKNFVEDMTI